MFKKKIVTVSSQNFFDQCANTIMLTVETDVQYTGLHQSVDAMAIVLVTSTLLCPIVSQSHSMTF